MTDLRQAAQQALEALETLSKLGNGNSDGNSIGNTIAQEAREHLFTALAQPEQKPVSCRFCHDARGCWTWQCYHCGEIDDVQKPAPLPVQEPTDIAALVEGMEVSIDVSTGEHDSDSRLFGTVTLAQENQGSKHGLILLIQDAEPNFQPAPPVQEPVAWTTMPEADDWDFVSGNKDPTGKLEGKWFPLYTAPPAVERPWVGLKEKNK